MRLASLLATLLLAAALPLGAQADAGADTAGGGAADVAGAGARSPERDLAGEWKKVVGHWAMVEGLPPEERAEHLEMHRGMLRDFMDGLACHAASRPPSGAGEDGAAAMRKELGEVRAHWEMVEGIEDPDQLRTHLAMHMRMLRSLYGQGAGAGFHPLGDPAAAGGAGHEGMEHGEEMDHEGMEHDSMDHGGMHEDDEGATSGPARRPAGY